MRTQLNTDKTQTTVDPITKSEGRRVWGMEEILPIPSPLLIFSSKRPFQNNFAVDVKYPFR